MLLTATASSLYGSVKNNLKTTLSTNISDFATTIVVASTTGFPSSGIFSIGDEVVFYTGISGTAFTGCQRGADGTTASSFLAGEIVELRWVAAHHNAIVDEIVRIESVLGANVSSLSATVDERITTFNDSKSTTVTFPVSPRLGAKHFVSGTNTWYLYNGVSWDILATSMSLGEDINWNLSTVTGISYILPTTAPLVSQGNAALFQTSTLSSYISSTLSGVSAIGREDQEMAIKTPSNEIVHITESDRLAVPRLAAMQIDFPEINKVSNFITIPDGDRNIRKAYFTIAGDNGACTVTINKLKPDTSVSSYSAVTTVHLSLSEPGSSVSGNVYQALFPPETPGSSRVESVVLFTPSVGDSGIITLSGRENYGYSCHKVFDTVTEYLYVNAPNYVYSTITYAYNKTSAATITLTPLNTIGSFASYPVKATPFYYWIENIGGGIQLNSNADTTWATTPIYYPPFIPPYVVGDTIAGSAVYTYEAIDVNFTAAKAGGYPSSQTIKLSSISLGSWNDASYSISAGDVLFAMTPEVEGSPDRINVTVEAPYYIG